MAYRSGGTPGSTALNVNWSAGQISTLTHFAEVDWDGEELAAGDITIRLNVTNPQTGHIQWDGLRITLISSTCASRQTIFNADFSSGAVLLDTAQVYTKTQAISAATVTPDVGDRIRIQLRARNTDGSNTRTMTHTPATIHDTPWTLGVEHSAAVTDANPAQADSVTATHEGLAPAAVLTGTALDSMTEVHVREDGTREVIWTLTDTEFIPA